MPGTRFIFRSKAILETGVEQPHLTVGSEQEPGGFRRAAPPSRKV